MSSDHSLVTLSGIFSLMSFFKQPTFQERAELAAKAKQAALEKLRAKPPRDEAVLAARREAEALREAARAKARAEKLAARELEKAEKANRAPPPDAAAPALTQEEQKRLRDAKYAARKSRSGKR
jgi:hypothetical protein